MEAFLKTGKLGSSGANNAGKKTGDSSVGTSSKAQSKKSAHTPWVEK
jgi:hypothetical protein